MKVVATILLMACFTYQSISAQELPSGAKQQLENLAEVTESDIEDDSYLQQIEFLRRDPLDLNKAMEEDLRIFPFLTDLQIDHFLRYRSLLGPFISLYELQSIPSWDVQTIQKLLSFVTLRESFNKEDFWERLKEGQHQILVRSSRVLEKTKGFEPSTTNRFLGDRNHILLRYRYQYKNLLQYGITTDKDAGEPFFKNGSRRGFDFYSAHLFARNIGSVKALAIGDFTVNLGQGLIHWQSLAFKKSAEVMSIKRQSAVLRPYSSAGEFYFSRGAGITIEKGKIQATFFGSYRNISGNIVYDSIEKQQAFSSFSPFGLHRNNSEIGDRNRINQVSYGGNISFHHSSFQIGLNAIEHRYSKPFQKQQRPYNLYSWSGQTWSNLSIDYSKTFKNIHAFGEAALAKNGGKAVLNGAMISIDPKIDVSILHRHIQQNFQSVYGNAFTESVLPSNEAGFYTGVSLKPSTSIRINMYADVYRFPWLKFRVDAPSRGKDFFMQLSYQPNKQIEIYTRFRFEEKQINESSTNYPTNLVNSIPRQNWRLNFSYQLSPKFLVRNRVDMVWYDVGGKGKEQGYLFFSEGHFRPNNSFSANLRLQFFETGGFNSRIYAYENDVLYGFSVPAFFGKGIRYYTNLNFDFNKRLSLWMRWAQFLYGNQKEIGSGLGLIEGNMKTEIRFQALFYLK